MIVDSVEPLVSVCVPTHCRKTLLAHALASIERQTYPAIEILIGDDSPDDDSAEFVARFAVSASREIRYVHNRPGLGQNANVQSLFQAARGAYLLLLHDDDALNERAVETMLGPFGRDPALQLVFGKQQMIDEHGTVDDRDTKFYNTRDKRTSAFAGRQKHSLASALLGQVPNNGFLVRAEIAKKIGYRSFEEVGVFCDLDFSIRLAQHVAPQSFHFVDAFVSQYRETGDAISRSAKSHVVDHPDAGLKMFLQISAIAETPEIAQARKLQLTRQSDKAFKGYAFRGERREALRIFFSPYYPALRRFSTRGLYHLSLLFWPGLERMRWY